MERLGKVCFTETQVKSVIFNFSPARVSLPGSREDSHQLLKGLERRSDVEFDVVLLDVFHVCGKGRIVVWIEPLP